MNTKINPNVAELVGAAAEATHTCLCACVCQCVTSSVSGLVSAGLIHQSAYTSFPCRHGDRAHFGMTTHAGAKLEDLVATICRTKSCCMAFCNKVYFLKECRTVRE